MTRTEFLLHYQYSIKHTSVENKEENSIRELQVDPQTNSPTDIISNLWQAAGRIVNDILVRSGEWKS